MQHNEKCFNISWSKCHVFFPNFHHYRFLRKRRHMKQALRHFWFPTQKNQHFARAFCQSDKLLYTKFAGWTKPEMSPAECSASSSYLACTLWRLFKTESQEGPSLVDRGPGCYVNKRTTCLPWGWGKSRGVKAEHFFLSEPLSRGYPHLWFPVDLEVQDWLIQPTALLSCTQDHASWDKYTILCDWIIHLDLCLTS